MDVYSMLKSHPKDSAMIAQSMWKPADVVDDVFAEGVESFTRSVSGLKEGDASKFHTLVSFTYGAKKVPESMRDAFSLKFLVDVVQSVPGEECTFSFTDTNIKKYDLLVPGESGYDTLCRLVNAIGRVALYPALCSIAIYKSNSKMSWYDKGRQAT